MDLEKKDGMRVVKIIGWAVAGLVIAAGTAFLFGFFVMLLWNWLMPTIFGLVEITYIQAWGLVLLAHILFKSGHSGKGGYGRKGHGERGHGRFGSRCRGKGNWKKEFYSKMKDHEMSQSDNENKDNDGINE